MIPKTSLEISVPATDLPVLGAELADHVSLVAEDYPLKQVQCIRQAVDLIEGATRRALMTQTRILRLAAFPADEQHVIELPGGMIQSVTGITYRDAVGADATLSAGDYDVQLGTGLSTGYVSLAYGATWPEVLDRGLPVAVTYVAGWAQAHEVPAGLQMAVLRVAASLFDQVYATPDKVLSEDPYVRMMMDRYRIHWTG